jgi:WD40 repeat protein
LCRIKGKKKRKGYVLSHLFAVCGAFSHHFLHSSIPIFKGRRSRGIIIALRVLRINFYNFIFLKDAKMKKGLFLLVLAAVVVCNAVGQPRILINTMGHSAKIENLVFTPDGDKIISISDDKTARVWNFATGEMLKKFETKIGDGSEGSLYSSAVSPDGKLFAMSGFTTTPDKQIYIAIIDLTKGAQIATAVGHTDVVNALAFTSDSKYLVSGSNDGQIKVWTVSNSTQFENILSIPVGGAINNLALNAMNRDVAVAVEGKTDIVVYSLTGLERNAVKMTPRNWRKHRGTVNKLTYSADGTYLSSSSSNNELFLWRADGSLVKDFSVEKPITAIAFSNDAKILAALDETGKGISYSLPGGNKFSDFNGHDNTVFCAAFSPLENGSYVVASAGGNNNEIYLWNPINGKSIRKIRGKGSAIHDLAFGSGLELFISQQANAKPNEFKRSFDFLLMKLNASAPKFTPLMKDLNDGIKQTSENSLSIRGKVIKTDPVEDGRILDYQGTPEGNVVVASDLSLKMFDRNGAFLKDFVGHTAGVRTVTISADGRYLASGSEDQTIILWKLNETGAAPSLRKTFPEESWSNFFASLPVDSLTKEPSKQAWQSVINYLKQKGDKTYKGIEEVYKNLGETVLPFVTLFISEDNEWVCWAHKGYFSCTSAGSQYFGWHVNKGIEKLSEFYAAEQFFEILYRPKEVEKSIAQGKRVEDILREEGERIFDLSRLQSPSAGFFTTRALLENGNVRYSEGKLVTEKKSIQVDVEVFDGGGGIKEVNIYQNDKLILSDDKVKGNGVNTSVTKTYDLELLNGTNEFKVIVVNFQKIESRPELLKIEFAGKATATSSLHLLVVGINKYKNSAYNLNYAQPDAKAFMDKITSQGERIFKNINPIELYDESATKDNILNAFNQIAVKARPEDVFVFFYAGHGSLDEEHKDKEGDSPFYFVPTDVTQLYGDPEQLARKGLSGEEIQDNMTKIRATKQIILTDACHSGGALKTMKTRAIAGDEKAIAQLARSSGAIWIASSGTKQFATEFETLKHGVFTYALLEALDGKADLGGDGKITVSEIKFYLEDRVPDLTKQYGGESQYPMAWMRGSDFPITVKGEK